MRFLHFDTLGSTNAFAKSLAEPKDGARSDFGPLWISTKRQTAGKGRRGREWISKAGNLFCTGLYPHTGDPASAARLSFAAALAVAETLDQYIPSELIAIKWPNDVLVTGKKISGILLESGTHESKNWISIGIGINLTNCPDIENYGTTHMRAHIVPEDLATEDWQGAEPIFTGARPVLAVLVNRFDHWRDIYLAQGFEPLRTAWIARAQGMGKAVTVRLPNKTIQGTALGMDTDGALEVLTVSGENVKIHAGDVFFSQ